MSIKCVRLITGEDILAEVSSDKESNSVILNNPVQVSIVLSRTGGEQPSFRIIPFPLVSTDKTIEISRSNIIFECEPAEEFIHQYNSLFGAGIVVPPNNIIV